MKSKIILIVLAVCVASCFAHCEREADATAESYICEGISSLGDLETVPAAAQRITIVNSNLNTLPGSAFTKWAASLTYLNITTCHLTDILPGAFTSLTNLRELVLDNNNIKIIKANWIQEIPNLKILRIWKNHIKEIESEVFHHLPHLELLDIAYNDIDYCITKKDFAKLKSLDIIYVTGNPWPLRCRPEIIFHLENHHVQLVHNWRTLHLFIADCLAHEFGAAWDDEILQRCVESHTNTSPLPSLICHE